MGTSQTDLDLPLVRALQEGDESALNELIRKYQEPLFRFIWRYTGDEETARDLLQETFVRLYFGIRRFKPRAKFATWLYSIAMNLCRDYARSKQRRQSYATESLDVGDAHREMPAADRAPRPMQNRTRGWRLWKRQSRNFHTICGRRCCYLPSKAVQQECAELLGVSAKAVETRVYRARKCLENTLRATR